jgi:Txe/YoeB family toxin of Txe-Axe toxin-antitoxin module
MADVCLRWHDRALADYAHWQKHSDGTARRIDALIASILYHFLFLI